MDGDLEEPAIAVKIAKILMLGQALKEFIDEGQREVVFPGTAIEFSVINAYTPPSYQSCGNHLAIFSLHNSRAPFLWDNMNRAHPFAIRDRVDDPNVQKLMNLFPNNFSKIRFESSLDFNRRFVIMLHQDVLHACGGVYALKIPNCAPDRFLMFSQFSKKFLSLLVIEGGIDDYRVSFIGPEILVAKYG
jgi:hypothetical protein